MPAEPLSAASKARDRPAGPPSRAAERCYAALSAGDGGEALRRRRAAAAGGGTSSSRSEARARGALATRARAARGRGVGDVAPPDHIGVERWRRRRRAAAAARAACAAACREQRVRHDGGDAVVREIASSRGPSASRGSGAAPTAAAAALPKVATRDRNGGAVCRSVAVGGAARPGGAAAAIAAVALPSSPSMLGSSASCSSMRSVARLTHWNFSPRRGGRFGVDGSQIAAANADRRRGCCRQRAWTVTLHSSSFTPSRREASEIAAASASPHDGVERRSARRYHPHRLNLDPSGLAAPLDAWLRLAGLDVRTEWLNFGTALSARPARRGAAPRPERAAGAAARRGRRRRARPARWRFARRTACDADRRRCAAGRRFRRRRRRRCGCAKRSLAATASAFWASGGCARCAAGRAAALLRLSRARGARAVAPALAAFAGEVRELARTLAPTRKVLCLDCDNTLWGGAVGEPARPA